MFKALFLFFFFMFSMNSWSKTFDVLPRVIYGIDDRSDIYQSNDNLMKELSHSVAAQVMDSGFQSTENNVFVLGTRTLQNEGMCSTERFSNQVAVANCSGFLIGSDVLVTAGHCVRDTASCGNHRWVFDYANYESEQKTYTFNNDQVYRCTKVISQAKDSTTGIDYAVVKLDRKVVGRTPFKIRKTGKVADDAILTVIGFPSGLPMKITTAGAVRDNSKDAYFVMNSDTYGGNSGSVVVDTKTGTVEGILVRGDTDYQKSETDDCLVSVIRPQDGGRGEDATRITKIKLK